MHYLLQIIKLIFRFSILSFLFIPVIYHLYMNPSLANNIMYIGLGILFLGVYLIIEGI